MYIFVLQGVKMDNARIQDINSLADKLIRQGRTDTKAIKLKKDVLNERSYLLPISSSAVVA